MNSIIGMKIKLVIVTFCCLLIFSCNNTNSRKDKKVNENAYMNLDNQKLIESNKALVHKLYKSMNESNWAVAKTLVDKDYRHYYLKDTAFASIPWSGFEEGNRMSRKGFPDWSLTPIKVIAEGEYVSVLLQGHGTHRGEFAGIPATNIKASAPIMVIHQIRNGKIIADWEMSNTDLFLKQLKKN